MCCEYVAVFFQYSAIEFNRQGLLQQKIKELNFPSSIKQLIGAMGVKQLKAKIKSIEDDYRQELHKYENRKRVAVVLKNFIC